MRKSSFSRASWTIAFFSCGKHNLFGKKVWNFWPIIVYFDLELPPVCLIWVTHIFILLWVTGSLTKLLLSQCMTTPFLSDLLRCIITRDCSFPWKKAKISIPPPIKMCIFSTSKMKHVGTYQNHDGSPECSGQQSSCQAPPPTLLIDSGASATLCLAADWQEAKTMARNTVFASQQSEGRWKGGGDTPHSQSVVGWGTKRQIFCFIHRKWISRIYGHNCLGFSASWGTNPGPQWPELLLSSAFSLVKVKRIGCLMYILVWH